MATKKAAPTKTNKPGDRIEELGLSKLFASTSTTRRAAELLLTGEPITRQELVRRTNVVETVVPRTVNKLRAAGIQIDTEQDPVTKSMTYRAHLPTIDKATEGACQFTAREGTEPTVRLEHMEADIKAGRRTQADGVQMTVRLAAPFGTVTGTAPMNPLLMQAATDGLPLSSVLLLPGGKQEWILGRLPHTVLVSDITYM